MTQKDYVLVDSFEKLQEMISAVKVTDLIAFDIETNSLNPRKGKIIGFSLSTEEGNGWYVPTLVYNGNKGTLDDFYIESYLGHDIAKKVIGSLCGKKLIGHNFGFDAKFVKCYYDIDLVPSIYADTMLLVHTLSEEGAGGNTMGRSFALKNIAKVIQEHIGIDVDKEANEEQLELKASIKANLGTTSKDNYEIFKADLPILAKYAAADTDLTMRVYNHYLAILKQEGLEKFFFEDEVMPLYRDVTIPMEQSGVKLDIELISNTHQRLTEDMNKYYDLVIKELLALPEVRTWCILKATDAYPASNKGSFAQALIKHYNITLPTSEKTGKFNINTKNLELLEDSKIKDFLMTGDLMYLDEGVSMKISMQLWKEDNKGEYFNIQSKDHMGEIAFGALQLKPISETKTGKPQFDEDMIQSIAKEHAWAKNLRIYNKLLKIRSTYVERFLDAHEDGIFYGSYKQHATVTGRYGSDMQQLPRPLEEGEDEDIIVNYTSLIRAFFIPREGNAFIDDDYQSLEPRIFSHIANDDGLKEIFSKNYDFYSTIAIKTEKLNQYSPDPKDPNYLKKVAPGLRNKAKGYSLGVPYGMGGYALAMTIGVNKKEGAQLVEDYLNAFPQLRSWMETSKQFAKENGYVKNEVGRIRHLPRVKQIYERLGDDLMDYKKKKALEIKYGKDKIINLYRDYKNGLNASMNFQIQSLAAAVVNRSAIEITKEFKKQNIFGWVCANIHDQLVIEVKKDQAEIAAKIVQDKMENTYKLGVKLVAEPSIAYNLRDGH